MGIRKSVYIEIPSVFASPSAPVYVMPSAGGAIDRRDRGIGSPLGVIGQNIFDSSKVSFEGVIVAAEQRRVQEQARIQQAATVRRWPPLYAC